MKKIFIIALFTGLTAITAYAGDEITLTDLRKHDDAKKEANAAAVKWWLFSNLRTANDDATTERWQNKAEQKLLKEARDAIRKERAIEKQIQKKERKQQKVEKQKMQRAKL